VTAEPVRLSPDAMHNLQDNLLLFYTGQSRAASTVLRDQDEKTRGDDQALLANLEFTKEIGLQSRITLESANLCHFAES